MSPEAMKLRPLKLEELDQAIALCDQCVGDNLYSHAELAETLEDPDRFFYVFATEQGELAGYIYFYVTDRERVAKEAKLDPALLEPLTADPNARVGKIQSVGVAEEYRRQGMAIALTSLAVEKLSQLGLDIVYIFCWKIGERVPLAKTLAHSHFRFLTIAKRIWYDHPDLYCPCCGGRCTCDAAVYYKLLKEG